MLVVAAVFGLLAHLRFTYADPEARLPIVPQVGDVTLCEKKFFFN
jgi:hypothetical protein